jgi:hypothetical protein
MTEAEIKGAAKKLEAEAKDLHARIDDIIKQRIYEVAAQISNVPTRVVQNMFIASGRCNNSYCRCRAIRNIAAGEDGL